MATSPDMGASGGEVDRRTFSTSFRGFDQGEVRSYLEVLAEEFTALRARIQELEEELVEARRPAPNEPLDVATLTRMVGEETGRVLRTAQEAAEDLRARAEEGAARALAEAHEEAARVRGAAEGFLAERSAEAERTVQTIESEAREKAEQLLRDARAEADRTTKDAIEQGRDMLAQAKAARERVLADLGRRRRSGLAQVEQLRAGRERVVASLATLRAELDRITADLAAADEVARQAQEAAAVSAKRQDSEPPDDSPEPLAPVREEAPEAPAPTSEAPEVPAAQDAPAVLAPGPELDDVDVVATSVGGAPPPPPPPPLPTAPPAPPPQPPPPSLPRKPEADADRTEDALVAEETLISAPRKRSRRGKDTPGPVIVPAGPAYPHDDVPAAMLPASAVGTAVLDGPPPADDAGPPPADDAGPPPADDAGLPPAAGAEPGPPAEAKPKARSKPKGGPKAAVDAHLEAPTADALFARIRADRAAATDEARTVLAADANAEAPAPAPGGSGDVANEAYLQRRDAAVEAVQTAIVRVLRRSLADDQNAALDRLRTLRGDRIELDALLGAEAEQVRAWADRAAGGLGDAAGVGAALGRGDLGRLGADDGAGVDAAVDGGDSTPVDAALVAPLAQQLAAELVGSLRAKLETLLESIGRDRGPDTVDRINGAYREWRSRVDGAVGDAVTAAVSAGFRAAVEPATPVTWIVEDVDGPCPDCDDNALAGSLPLGEPFPTGQDAPPAHPGCRCVLSRATP